MRLNSRRTIDIYIQKVQQDLVKNGLSNQKILKDYSHLVTNYYYL